MKKILILGAGLSSSSLIRYLLEKSEELNITVRVGDLNKAVAEGKTSAYARGEAFELDGADEHQLDEEISKSDLVISMLPAFMHIKVIKLAIKHKINCITPSYITDEIEALDEEAKAAGIMVLNEAGLDPGIDHMSAMKIIDEIKNKGGKMLLFESFTGGLVAPESDDNPWNYKFTWNPRNVVLAGQGGVAKFIQEGKYKYIPYNKLFRRTEFIPIDNLGWFEGYANRDSLKYRRIYGLDNIPTIYRGTLRRKGFSRAWDVFVNMGMTDDSYVLEGSKDFTHRDFINSFLPYNQNDSVELKMRHYARIEYDDSLWDKMVWLGLFSDEKIGLDKDGTPAQLLQRLLEKKWSMQPQDKDMIVMYHKFGYELNGERKEIESSLVSIGEDATYTAMANTVGLPIAICAEMIVKGAIDLKGVYLPTIPEIYTPVLNQLEKIGIIFNEKEVAPTIY